MKSLMLLWKEVANELATRCRTSATQDIKYVERRVEHEGVSFLTITLASFGKDFQRVLDQGFVEINSFPKFRKKSGKPLFLEGFLSQVFDPSSGRLLEEPNIEAIFAIRQLTLMFSKILLPIADWRLEQAIDGYIECENQVREFDKKWEEYSDILSLTLAVNRVLSADLFSVVDRKVYYGEIIPKHGPGSTADRLIGNNKYNQVEWTERLEQLFPFGENAIPNWRHASYISDNMEDGATRVTWHEPGSERPVRVVHVPKTMKSPRIIAIEPTCMQYMQQGLAEALIQGMADDSLISHFISIEDQAPNQRLASIGSIDGSLATIDLSEASDRISNQLIRQLLSNHPHLALGVDSCRSRTADVFGRRVIRLSKFASMGSALTFPIQSIVFLTIIFTGISLELKRPLTRKDILSFSGKVRVYGDDLIVPVEYVHSVVRCLEAYGLKVNVDKSFWTGKFRESCGKDYYDGSDVSITKVRRVFPSQRTDVSEVVSLVALRNQFYFAGLWSTAKWLDTQVRAILPHYPDVYPTSSLLGRHTVLPLTRVERLDSCHRPVVRGYVVKSIIPQNSLDDVPALLKFFLKRGVTPLDSNHLERSGRPLSVDIKQRMAPVF